jgi:RNA polymerase sigma-70 factor (ECF subfamily)
MEPAPNDAAGTLGALLYADRSRARIPEAEWVALVAAVAQGDQIALHALYVRTHRLVFTLALRISGSRETADELTVDTFHEVWKRAGTYDVQAGTVIGWIMNQARSRAIDRLRFEHRKKRVDSHGYDAASDATAHDAAAGLERAEQGRVLRAALGVLTPPEREAIETAFFRELTHAEVALRLQQPLGTIKTRIRSGLLKLRAALAAPGSRR